MKKIIFSDIDRTLAIEEVISDKNKKAIEEYIKKGGLFVLVSGRSVSYTKIIANKLKGIRYIICTNGSIIYDLKDNKIIYSNKISYDSLVKVYELCNENNFKFIMTGIDKDLVNKDPLSNQEIFNNLNKTLYESIDVTQIVVYGSSKDKIINIENMINKIEDIEVINKNRALYDKTYVSNKNYWLDVASSNTNKGSAVKKLCNLLNIDLKDTVRIGDDLNDLPMFLDKGLNVAVDNAMQDLKNKADFITLSCKDDGMAHLIEKIINNEL